MDRRSFLKGLAGTALVAAAPPLILPEKKIWQLDQTMITPRFDAGVSSFEKLFAGWEIIKRAGFAAPWEEWVVYKPSVPGAGFTFRFDLAYPSELANQRRYHEIKRGILEQEYLIATRGVPNPLADILPGYAQSVTYSQPMPEVKTDPEDWVEWWR